MLDVLVVVLLALGALVEFGTGHWLGGSLAGAIAIAVWKG